jgi:NAD(P)-dependent dehydrogenase (short-subunit alcohol dehydrogenase family)
MRNSRPTRSSPHSLAEAQNTLAHARRIEHQAVYEQLAELGFAYHGAFRGVQELSVRDGEVLARIAVAQEHHLSLTGYEIAPPFLDACFHALLLGYAGTRDPGDVLLPIGIDRLVSHAPLEEVGWVHGTMHSSDARLMVADLIVYADDGRTLLALEGLRIKSIRANQDAKTLAALFHTLEWRAIDGEAKRETAAGTGSWLVLGDQTERGKEFVAEIRGNGGRVCQVQRGPTFERAPREELLFSMDPNQVDAFDRLFATLHEVDFLPSRVIYLWALDAPEPEDRCGRSLMRAQQVGVLALLHLVQAIERIKWPRLPELWIFTRGARQVGDTPYPVSLTQTPLNGFAAALFHQEHPELAGGIIDLDPVQRRGEGEKVIHLLQRPPLDREIAMRGDTLYGQRLAVAPHLAQGTLPARMRADASYLISGGRGGLGLEMARWLISRGARRLILAGRSPLPERSQWPNLDRRSSTWKTVEQIRRLEAMGASILTPVLDVADDDAIAAYYESFRREGWPALRGVIHAAGIVQPMRLSALRSESFENTLAPKVAGAWNLYSLLKDEPLDFFIACSSANALGFSTGVIDYAAANAFLDGLAHHARFEKRPLLAINWGAWGEVGMASNVDVSHDFILRGILPIAPKQGIEAIERSLEHDLTQVLVLAANWQRLLSNFSAAELPVFVAPLVEQMKSSFGDARGDESGIKNLGVLLACLEDDDQRRAHLENFLIESVSRVLKLPVDRIDLSQRLVDFGMDSIIAVELRQTIAAQLRVGPTLMEVLQGGSIASLRDTLLARLAPIWLEKDANTVAQTDEIGVETPKSDDEGLDDLARALSDLSPEARELLLRDCSAADDDRTCSETLRSFADELA